MAAITFDQPSQGTVSSNQDALLVTNNGSGNGVEGVSSQGNGLEGSTSGEIQAGVHGSTSGYSAGVWGENGQRPADFWDDDPRWSAGVRGSNWGEGGPNEAISAIFAEARTAYGLYAYSQYNDAVFGESSNRGNGVRGESNQGDGVFGRGRNGVHGQSESAQDSGVWGENTGAGFGVAGASVTGEGVLGRGRNGVHGQSESAQDSGVWGENTGGGYGVTGMTSSQEISARAGVWGDNAGSGDGVRGTSRDGNGVFGHSINSFSGIGVLGMNASSDAHGGLGGYDGGSSPKPVGVFGANWKRNGYAGFFAGNVEVTGWLWKSAGGFKIDHPVDPANKYLFHSFVESPDMKNVYDGVSVLDSKGEAVVELPTWFEALNRDFRYQLTAIGGPSPNLHIAQEITGNRFRIAGAKPGSKVSWQVTGIRHDRYAEQHRPPVEADKVLGARGKYLSPVEHGMPESAGIDYGMRLLLQRRATPPGASNVSSNVDRRSD